MLRICRASSSSWAVARRPLSTTCRRPAGGAAGSPSDGLFPPAPEPKADLAPDARRGASPLDREPPATKTAGGVVGGGGPAGKRRLPALKGMQQQQIGGGALAKALLASGSNGGSGADVVQADERLSTGVGQQRPVSALDALLPSSSVGSRSSTSSSTSSPAAGAAAAAASGVGRPSSILTDILNSPALGPSSSSSAAVLSRSSPYLPTTTTTTGPAAQFLTSAAGVGARAHSIFTSPPTPPPTYTLIVNLKVSRNNTLATIAYAHSGEIVPGCEQISGGTVGFRKAAQGGFEAGHQVACAILRAIREENGRKLREKRDFRKVFYRARAEARRQELVEAFEGLKARQAELAEEKAKLELEAPDFAAAAAAGGAAAPAGPKPKPATTYAASESLALADDASTSLSSSALATAAAGRSYLQRKAALAHAQRSLADGLAAYNGAVRLLSSELRDLQANKIPSDALLPTSARQAGSADIVQEEISAELKEAEEQAAGQVGVYFKVLVGGFGQGREAFLTALMGREGHFVRPLCTGLGDASHMKCVWMFLSLSLSFPVASRPSFPSDSLPLFRLRASLASPLAPRSRASLPSLPCHSSQTPHDMHPD